MSPQKSKGIFGRVKHLGLMAATLQAIGTAPAEATAKLSPHVGSAAVVGHAIEDVSTLGSATKTVQEYVDDARGTPKDPPHPVDPSSLETLLDVEGGREEEKSREAKEEAKAAADDEMSKAEDSRRPDPLEQSRAQVEDAERLAESTWRVDPQHGEASLETSENSESLWADENRAGPEGDGNPAGQEALEDTAGPEGVEDTATGDSVDGSPSESGVSGGPNDTNDDITDPG